MSRQITRSRQVVHRSVAALLVALFLVWIDAGRVAAQQPSGGSGQPAQPALPIVDKPSAPPAGGAPPFQRKLEPEHAKIGQVISFSVSLRHPGNLACRVPDGASFGKLELLGRDRQQVRDEAGTIQGETFAFSLAGYEAGQVELPPLPLDCVDQTGQEHHLEVPGGKVRIHSLLENQQIQDMKPPRSPVTIEQEDLTLLYLAVILLSLLVGGVIGLMVYRFWKRRPRPELPVPPRPAEEVARERLAALERSELLIQGQFKEFYLELSHILREYLEGRFGTDATAMTSTELVDALYDMRGTPRRPPNESYRMLSRIQVLQSWSMLHNISRRELMEFFDEADLVEFARYEPSAQELIAIFAKARALVERTTPEAPTPAESTSNDNPPPLARPLQTGATGSPAPSVQLEKR